MPLLQAISDWQRGGDAKQVKKRGANLKALCAALPDEFRSTSLVCFRQLALKKDSVWKLVADDLLPERISAWTNDPDVAKSFKGGVPPSDWQGVVLHHFPHPSTVIVNLRALYGVQEFTDELERNRHAIAGYADGAGKYSCSQSEVVLEVAEVGHDDIYSLGGAPSSYQSLIRQAAAEIYGPNPTAAELEVLEWRSQHLRDQLGPRWLSHDAAKRVLAQTKPAAAELLEIKRQRGA